MRVSWRVDKGSRDWSDAAMSQRILAGLEAGKVKETVSSRVC